MCVCGPISGPVVCLPPAGSLPNWIGSLPLVQATEELLELGHGVRVAVRSKAALDWPALALARSAALALALATAPVDRLWPEQCCGADGPSSAGRPGLGIRSGVELLFGKRREEEEAPLGLWAALPITKELSMAFVPIDMTWFMRAIEVTDSSALIAFLSVDICC